MAKTKASPKKKRIIIRLVSSAKTGHFYTTTIGKKRTSKLVLKKYDPVTRTRVSYEEKKI